MNAFRNWIWGAPRHGLAPWLLLIVAIPLIIAYGLTIFSGTGTIYTIPAASVWVALALMQTMELLPRRWVTAAAIGRSVALILGWAAALWLLWMLATSR